MTPTELVSLIAKVPLFASLPPAERIHLANTLQPCEFESDELLLREGETDEHFYILLEGEVDVIKAFGSPDQRQLAVRHPGTIFGEMSLFDPQGCHTASVRARTPLRNLSRVSSVIARCHGMILIGS